MPQPHESGCNSYTRADLENDLDEPEPTYFLDFFEKFEDEILPIEEFGLREHRE